MCQENLKLQIEQILDSSSVGTMATVKKQMPHSRYMTFSHENLTLYTQQIRRPIKQKTLKSIHIPILFWVMRAKGLVTNM